MFTKNPKKKHNFTTSSLSLPTLPLTFEPTFPQQFQLVANKRSIGNGQKRLTFKHGQSKTHFRQTQEKEMCANKCTTLKPHHTPKHTKTQTKLWHASHYFCHVIRQRVQSAAPSTREQNSKRNIHFDALGGDVRSQLQQEETICVWVCCLWWDSLLAFFANISLSIFIVGGICGCFTC